MALLFANNAVSTLVGSITDSNTSLTVATGDGALFPNPSGGDTFLATLFEIDGTGNEWRHEVIEVTARSSDTFTFTRDAEGTGANSYPSSGGETVYVQNRPTAGTAQEFLQAGENFADVNNAATARTNIGLGSSNSPTFAGATLSGLLSVSRATSGEVISAQHSLTAPTYGSDLVPGFSKVSWTAQSTASTASLTGLTPGTIYQVDWTLTSGSYTFTATLDGATVAVLPSAGTKGFTFTASGASHTLVLTPTDVITATISVPTLRVVTTKGGAVGLLLKDASGGSATQARVFTTALQDTAVGAAALQSCTLGSANTAVGSAALTALTTGKDNTAAGVSALTALTAGYSNTAVGTSALASSVYGYDNTAIGYRAGYALTGGAANLLGGVAAGAALTTGAGNVALGFEALKSETTTSGSVAIGSGALKTSTSGANTVIGYNAGELNTDGFSLTGVGYYALGSNTTGDMNVAVGHRSLFGNTTGESNTAIGYYAAWATTTGSYNVAVGHSALMSGAPTSNNVAIGYEALRGNTVSGSTAVGYKAGKSMTTGTGCTAVGNEALRDNSTSANNTAVGYSALKVSTGADNTAVGYSVLVANTTGVGNTAVGVNALYGNTTGAYNCAVGRLSLRYNSTGAENTAIGEYSLYSNTSGSANTALGRAALYSNTTGTNNVAVGSFAGRYYGAGSSERTTGDNCVYLGAHSRASADGVNSEVVIGAYGAVGSGANTVTLGDTSNTTTVMRGSVMRLTTAKTPASASASGTTGDICWDSSYLYVCTGTNTWKRVAIATW